MVGVEGGFFGAVDWGGILSGLGLAIIWFLVIGVLGAVFWFVATYMQYNVIFRVRLMANNRQIIVDDKARHVSKNGHEKYKLWKLGKKLPIPPATAIDINKRGKKVVECVMTEDGDVVYLNFGFQDGLGSVDPLKLNHRSFFANEIRDAHMHLQKNWQDLIMWMTPIVAAIVIVTVFLLFGDRLMGPFLEVGGSLAESAKVIAESNDVLAKAVNAISDTQVVPVS